MTNIRQMRHIDSVDASYSIRAVAEQTGLSAHTIRAWEKRYGAATPARTDSNRRMYGPDEVRRLRLLKGAVAAFEAPQVLTWVAAVERHAKGNDGVAAAAAFAEAHPLVESLLGELAAQVQ